MKTRKNYQALFLGLGFLATIGLSSCGSSQKAISTKAQGEELIEVFCTGPDYQSDKKHFRASAIGESLDQMVAKRKAGTNARAELATLIQSTVKGTIDNYVNSTELNNVEQVEERFEGLTREVINQQLNNIKVICEKQTRTAQNKYKTYIALEMSAEDLAKAIQDKLSKDEKLKVDYDYEKFKKTFDAEMQKLQQKQRGF
jgi:predicted transcriptional regulator